MKRKINKCKLCGIEIIIKHDNGRPRIWCSMKCKYNYNYKRKTGTNDCKTCGVKIPARQKVCGKQCYEGGSKWQSIQRLKKAYSNHYLAMPFFINK